MVKKANKRAAKPKSVPEGGEDFHFFYATSSPFSNFHPSRFVDEEGNCFFCSEQYMMYQKAILFEDQEIAEKILAEQNDPAKVKKLGRKVRGFDDLTWKANARRIMQVGLYLKFTQNKKIQRALLATGNKEIVEAAANDRIWGIGFNAAKALKVPRKIWGTNWLGEVLMNVRERIRNEHLAQEQKVAEAINQYTAEVQDSKD